MTDCTEKRTALWHREGGALYAQMTKQHGLSQQGRPLY